MMSRYSNSAVLRGISFIVDYRTLSRNRHGLSRYFTRTVYTCSASSHKDFYRYTGGRWLWDEQTQLQKRYKRFNVPELKRIAASSVKAETCVSMTKLAEGGFNKVFRLVMSNGSVVIARIPHLENGPVCKAIASEVATMDFALNILELPVPKVLAWSGEIDNPVESEYILMQEAVGSQLGDTWETMELGNKLKIVDQVVAIEKKFLSLSFAFHGNLYFTADRFPGCVKAEVVGDVEDSLKKDVEERFVIGPVVDKRFWDGERKFMDIDRGPWKRHQDYLKAISQREIAWLRDYATPKVPKGLFAESEAQRSPEVHVALYQKFQAVANYILPEKEEQVKATIWHWDIHAPNIFVDEGKITSLIDWQDVWAGPLFLLARHPRLVRYNGEVLLRLPEHYEALTDRDEKARLERQVERSITIWSYERETKKSNPVLHDILHLYQGRTRRDIIDFSANTWNGDIIPFRQCHINVERNWDEINSAIPCPIHFTQEEIQDHIRDGEGWNEDADFWGSLAGFVHRDGWTANENYEEALEYFRNLRDTGLETFEGDELAAFERQTRWAAREGVTKGRAAIEGAAKEEAEKEGSAKEEANWHRPSNVLKT